MIPKFNITRQRQTTTRDDYRREIQPVFGSLSNVRGYSRNVYNIPSRGLYRTLESIWTDIKLTDNIKIRLRNTLVILTATYVRLGEKTNVMLTIRLCGSHNTCIRKLLRITYLEHDAYAEMG